MENPEHFTYKPFGNQAFKVIAPNGVEAGELYMEVDGYYVFLPKKGLVGFYTQHDLMLLALKLSELNDAWDAMIQKDLRSAPAEIVTDLGDLFS